MTDVRCPLREAAWISANEKALLTGAGSLTYRELDQVASGCVLALVAAGIGRGDRVALRLGNDWRAIPLAMALLRLEAVVCPLNPRLPSTAQVEALRAVGCTRCVSVRGAGPAVPGLQWLAAGELVSLAGAGAGRVPPTRLTLAQPATIFFVEGRGGARRAVLHSLGNHYYSALGSNRNLPVRSGDTWLWSVPIHRVGGFQILFRCFLGGAAVSVPAAGVAHPVTHVTLAPAQLRRWLRASDAAPAVAWPRYILVDGGGLPEDVLAGARRRGSTVLQSYGSTEMTSQIAAVRPLEPSLARRMTAGRPLPYREVRVAEDGEILVRGHTRFLGYVEGDALIRPVDADGWFATGDLGRLDEAGYLSVLGRKSAQ